MCVCVGVCTHELGATLHKWIVCHYLWLWRTTWALHYQTWPHASLLAGIGYWPRRHLAHTQLPLLVLVLLGISHSLPPSPDDLKSAQSVLCPVSGIGTAFGVHKQVTIIGTGDPTGPHLHSTSCVPDNITFTCVYMYTCTCTYFE